MPLCRQSAVDSGEVTRPSYTRPAKWNDVVPDCVSRGRVVADRTRLDLREIEQPPSGHGGIRGSSRPAHLVSKNALPLERLAKIDVSPRSGTGPIMKER